MINVLLDRRKLLKAWLVSLPPIRLPTVHNPHKKGPASKGWTRGLTSGSAAPFIFASPHLTQWEETFICHQYVSILSDCLYKWSCRPISCSAALWYSGTSQNNGLGLATILPKAFYVSRTALCGVRTIVWRSGVSTPSVRYDPYESVNLIQCLALCVGERDREREKVYFVKGNWILALIYTLHALMLWVLSWDKGALLCWRCFGPTGAGAGPPFRLSKLPNDCGVPDTISLIRAENVNRTPKITRFVSLLRRARIATKNGQLLAKNLKLDSSDRKTSKQSSISRLSVETQSFSSSITFL